MYFCLSSRVEEEKDIYDISYCYTGMIAFVVSMTVSAVVSLLTGKIILGYIYLTTRILTENLFPLPTHIRFVSGPIRPENLREGVVNPTCERLYQKWFYTRRTSYNLDSVASLQSPQKMMSLTDTNTDNP